MTSQIPEIDEFQKKISHYLLGSTIGKGTFGKVKLAKEIYTSEKVAIKIIDKRSLILKEDIERVQNEISILKILKHRNIIQLYEIIQSKQNIYLVMDFAENGDLLQIIKNKKITELEICQYFQQLINGLQYLHSQGIAHRDLKPENILVTTDNCLKISDFGLSVNSEKQPVSLLSTPCGTPIYAPPEMLRGENYDGFKADLWNLGIILYSLVFGKLPFNENTESKLIKKIIYSEIEFPWKVSNDLQDLITRLLCKNPTKRINIEEIKSHSWFNLSNFNYFPGVIVKSEEIPVDEKCLERLENLGFSKNSCMVSILNNEHDQATSIYYLIVKAFSRINRESVSDYSSATFRDFALSEKYNKIFFKRKDSKNEDDFNFQVRNNSESQIKPQTNKTKGMKRFNSISTNNMKKDVSIDLTINNEKKKVEILKKDKEKIIKLHEKFVEQKKKKIENSLKISKNSYLSKQKFLSNKKQLEVKSRSKENYNLKVNTNNIKIKEKQDFDEILKKRRIMILTNYQRGLEKIKKQYSVISKEYHVKQKQRKNSNYSNFQNISLETSKISHEGKKSIRKKSFNDFQSSADNLVHFNSSCANSPKSGDFLNKSNCSLKFELKNKNQRLPINRLIKPQEKERIKVEFDTSKKKNIKLTFEYDIIQNINKKSSDQPFKNSSFGSNFSQSIISIKSKSSNRNKMSMTLTKEPLFMTHKQSEYSESIEFGIVDLGTIILMDKKTAYRKVLLILNRMKIVYRESSDDKIRCSKNGLHFEICVVEINYFSSCLRFKRRAGEFTSFFKINENIRKSIK